MNTRGKIFYGFAAILVVFGVFAKNLTAKQGALTDTGLYRGTGPTGFTGYTGGGNLLIPTPGTLPTPGVISPPIMPNISPVMPPSAPTSSPVPTLPGAPNTGPTPTTPTIPSPGGPT